MPPDFFTQRQHGTEVIAIRGFDESGAEKNLPSTLRGALSQGNGNVLVICSVGHRRSNRIKAAMPPELVANPLTHVGYMNVDLYAVNLRTLRESPDGKALELLTAPGVKPFTRMIIAMGNPDEDEHVDQFIIKPIVKKFGQIVTQIITVDMVG